MSWHDVRALDQNCVRNDSLGQTCPQVIIVKKYIYIQLFTRALLAVYVSGGVLFY